MSKINLHKLATELKSLIKSGRLSGSTLNEAHALYEQLHSSRHNSTDLPLTLAVLYRKSRLFREAASVCGQVLALQPHNALAHHIIGSIQQCQGNHDAAIASYRTAINLDSTLAETH
ncbi:MAG: hypothetical protein ACE5FQ_04425, partial [Thiogranum sp.]